MARLRWPVTMPFHIIVILLIGWSTCYTQFISTDVTPSNTLCNTVGTAKNSVLLCTFEFYTVYYSVMAACKWLDPVLAI